MKLKGSEKKQKKSRKSLGSKGAAGCRPAGRHLTFGDRQILARDWNAILERGGRPTITGFAKAHGLPAATWHREYRRGMKSEPVIACGDIAVKYGQTPYHPDRTRPKHPDVHPARTVPGRLQLSDRPAGANEGSVENANRMVRRWHPKGTDFYRCSKAEIAALQKTINSIHRRILGGLSADQFAQSLNAA